MIRWIDVLAVSAGFCILAACTSTQSLPQTGLATGATLLSSGVIGEVGTGEGCSGTGGVRVTPCPIRFTHHTKRSIVVTVSGPGVVGSYLKTLNECHHNRFCYKADRQGYSETRWRFTAGLDCGSANVELDGVDALGQTVGAAFLELMNRRCR